MTKFIIRRLIWTIPVILLVIFLTFVMMRQIKGNPFRTSERNIPASIQENLERNFGLDKPWYVQYVTYVKNVFTFDLGPSLVQRNRTVNDIVSEAFPRSLELGRPERDARDLRDGVATHGGERVEPERGRQLSRSEHRAPQDAGRFLQAGDVHPVGLSRPAGTSGDPQWSGRPPADGRSACARPPGAGSPPPAARRPRSAARRARPSRRRSADRGESGRWR